ncbi:MAG: SPOR domain-containing protein [Marinilabiliales bacterium]|nr:MAG: SPOR domain-containing protein [Marinilabiliales bacterium]
MKHNIIIASLFMLLYAGSYPVIGQQGASGQPASAIEQQYEDYINGALRYQVRADSLSRSANQKRRELAFIGDEGSRRQLESTIFSLERESSRVQGRADSLYTQARALEIRMTASGSAGVPVSQGSTARQNSPVPEENPSPVPATPLQDEGDQLPVPFLILGNKDISPWLTRGELSRAADLEDEFARAEYLKWRVSDMNDEKNRLERQLEAGVSRRDRRRIEQRIDEIDEEVINLQSDAIKVFSKTHYLRYTAALRFLEELREEQKDREMVRRGMDHQKLAEESFRQAGSLRDMMSDLRSGKYRNEYLLKAYAEELAAFDELENAMAAYTAVTETAADGVPRSTDGRIDTAAALSRASRGTVPETPGTAVRRSVDFGFSVLPGTPYSEQNPIPENPVLPGGLAYSVQLGIFNAGTAPSLFGGLTPLLAEYEAGAHTARYSAGLFRTHSEAERGLTEINRQGFTDAFIVAYNNGSRIPVIRAQQMERSAAEAAARDAAAREAAAKESAAKEDTARETVEREAAAREAPAKEASARETAAKETESISRPRPQEPPTEPERVAIVTFRLQIGVFSRMVDRDVYERWQRMAGTKKVEYTVNNRGLYVYTTGNFNTFEEAVAVRDRFRQGGVPDAFLVAYREDIRISMEEAGSILNKQLR